SDMGNTSTRYMRSGITIQPRACPWCHNRLTGRLARGLSICFNCGHHWHGQSPFEISAAGVEASHTLAPYDFGPDAMARLEVYRLAVRAGYSSDWCPTIA